MTRTGLRKRRGGATPAIRCFSGLIFCLVLTAANVPQLSQLQRRTSSSFFVKRFSGPAGISRRNLFYRAMVESRFGQEKSQLRISRSSLLFPATAFSSAKQMKNSLPRSCGSGDMAIPHRRWPRPSASLPPATLIAPLMRMHKRSTSRLQMSHPKPSKLAKPQQCEQAAIPWGIWDVPAEVNGHEGEWIFDTGANLSTLSESEAARIGLTLHETSTYVNGSTGTKNPLRFAVAQDLRLGNAHLRNVVFLVLSDQSLYIRPLKYQIRGILGLPVLRALGCVKMPATGRLLIETKAAARAGPPNMFLDGWDLIVDVRHSDQRLQMFLDTGANATFAYLHSVIV